MKSDTVLPGPSASGRTAVSVVPSDFASALRSVSFPASASALPRSPLPGSSFLSQASASGSDAQRFSTAFLPCAPLPSSCAAAAAADASGRMIKRAGAVPDGSCFTGRRGICSQL